MHHNAASPRVKEVESVDISKAFWILSFSLNSNLMDSGRTLDIHTSENKQLEALEQSVAESAGHHWGMSIHLQLEGPLSATR